jgi:transcriptional regulator with XRE-family HTH domain
MVDSLTPTAAASWVELRPAASEYLAHMPGADFGERLRAAREAAGLTPLQLSLAAGIRDTDINRWERKTDTDVRLSSARRIAQTLKVSVDYLAGLTDDPVPSGHAKAAGGGGHALDPDAAAEGMELRAQPPQGRRTSRNRRGSAPGR